MNITQKVAEVYFKTLCDMVGYDPEELRARCRRYEYNMKRVIIARAMRKHTNLSTPAIGFAMNRNHATILHLIKIDNLPFQDLEEARVNKIINGRKAILRKCQEDAVLSEV